MENGPKAEVAFGWDGGGGLHAFVYDAGSGFGTYRDPAGGELRMSLLAWQRLSSGLRAHVARPARSRALPTEERARAGSARSGAAGRMR
ncbi:MAG: hypothetical protein H6923_06025 [Alphaproteobacteria bacterium]|nr:hypothetical protein [Alphaproteobacteria bacterium]